MRNMNDSAIDAHAEGYEAAFNGESDTRNPYPIGTDENLSWNDGYESFFVAQDEARRADAASALKEAPKDPVLELLESMTPEKIAKKIGMPLSEWPGNCFAVASKLVEKFAWEGATAVYGHYHGEVSPDCKLFYGRPLVHHGWVLTKQGCVVDPTHWVFENKPAKIRVLKPWVNHKSELDEYDEGGEQYARAKMNPAPAFNPNERAFAVDEDQLEFADLAKCLLNPMPKKKPLREVSMGQVHWLANQPYTSLGAASGVLYRWLRSKKLLGLVPIDFLKRAEREGHFS